MEWVWDGWIFDGLMNWTGIDWSKDWTGIPVANNLYSFTQHLHFVPK
jgi:hypothetical protein